MAREIHLELLLGKQVLDSNGKKVGRIEEVRAEQQGDEWVVQEYLLGTTALLERLSAWRIGLGVLRWLGAYSIHGGYRVPWEKMDLTNPAHPRLLCSVDELNKLPQQPSVLES